MFYDPTIDNLNDLDPVMQDKAIQLINELRDRGFPAIITSGRRSLAHQAQLFVSHRTVAFRNSRHLNGTAVDIGFAWHPRRGVPRNWWLFAGRIGEALGLRWGGRFSAYDPVHFDLG